MTKKKRVGAMPADKNRGLPAPEAPLPSSTEAGKTAPKKYIPTEASRQANGQWIKGQSGNPAGRRKGLKNHITQERMALESSLRAYLCDPTNQQRVLNSIDRLFHICETGDEKVAASAIKVLLDKVMISPRDDGDTGTKPTRIEVIIDNQAQANVKPVTDIEDAEYEVIHE